MFTSVSFSDRPADVYVHIRFFSDRPADVYVYIEHGFCVVVGRDVGWFAAWWG